MQFIYPTMIMNIYTGAVLQDNDVILFGSCSLNTRMSFSVGAPWIPNISSYAIPPLYFQQHPHGIYFSIDRVLKSKYIESKRHPSFGLLKFVVSKLQENNCRLSTQNGQ